MNSTILNLSMNQEFAVHSAALAIKNLDRDDLEEAFIDLLHQNLSDRQLFLSILKDHGIDAEINFNFSTKSQLS